MPGLEVDREEVTAVRTESAASAPGIALWKRRDFWIAEFAALGARVGFLLATAGMHRSDDLNSWEKVAKMLEAGVNPYSASPYLNWPPFWMQILYGLDKFSVKTGVPFILSTQCFLILVDLALVAALYRLLVTLAPERLAGRVVLLALSLNPVCILLTCQHGNFDGLVALGVVLFLTVSIDFQRSRDPVDWLASCLLLGIAILMKTIPLALLPLLCVGTTQLRSRTMSLGGLLALGPAALGMSVIYALTPAGVTHGALAYRGFAGYFGIPGLLGLLQLSAANLAYSRVFMVVAMGSIACLGYLIYRRPERTERYMVLTAACSLLAIPLFGPGYGPQYLFWSLPLLAAVFHISDDSPWITRMLVVALEIAAITYIVEYAFFDSHGALALQVWRQSIPLVIYADNISSKIGETLVRLPLFVTLLCVFVLMVRDARKSNTTAA